jgi:type I restriction enzyme S subunit
MRTVPLGELGEIVSGSTPKTGVPEFWDGDIPWVTPADLSSHEGIYFHGKPKKISKAGFDSCSTAMLPSRSILFSSRAPIGHCAITAYPVCTNQGFKNIIPNERLDPVYGYFALKYMTSAIVAMGRGATFAEINKEIIESVEIPYCDLSEQRRIAGRLEQADRLRRTRRYALQLTDTFLPAAFLQCFGEPVTNPCSWERAHIFELGDVETGNTPPRENADYYGDAIEWIKSDNISLAHIYPSKAVEGLSEKGLAVGRVVDAGSLLLTCIAGSETSIGNVVLTDRRVAFNQQINAVTPHPDVNPWFLYGLLLTAKPLIQRSTTLAMKRMITKGKLEDLVLIKPPLPLQQKFAALVERVERLRAVQRESLRQADHLFASLLHHAFAGVQD